MKFFDVIRYEGPADALVWKSPAEDMNSLSQVVVNETQEAIFVKGGQVCDVLGPGTHALDTHNLPLLSSLIGAAFGGKTPFTAEVYYINKITLMDVKWGTASPVMLEDPKYGILVPVRAYGQFNIRVTDGKLLYTSLIGTSKIFSKEDLTQYFKGFVGMQINDMLASYLVHEKVSILEMNAHLNEISAQLQKDMCPAFQKYGMDLSAFYVQSVNLPQEDASVQQLKEALSQKASMNILGYDYKTGRTFDALEKAAANEGAAGGAMGVGMGAGVGFGMGEILKDSFSQATAPAQAGGTTAAGSAQSPVFCSQCGQQLAGESRFCNKCGTAVAPSGAGSAPAGPPAGN